MSSALDKSLDDLINSSKKSGGGASRGRGRGSGPGPARRFPNLPANRAAPHSMRKIRDDLYSDRMAARSSAIETGTKLYISNLDYGVSNEDIKELFSEVGDLKRFSINYDRSGRWKGTAEVVFSRQGDSIAALKRYNNVQLDGKPMKIVIIGTNIVTPAVVPQAMIGLFGNHNGALRSGSARSGTAVRPRGGGRGRGRGRADQISAADLDADLEKYHSEAMQIN